MNANRRLFASLSLLQVLVIAAIGMIGMLHAPTAEAANGQCKWEGGPGAAGGYAYCKAEDCKGNGGLARCTAPVGATPAPLGAAGWAYHMCDEMPAHQSNNAKWCGAAGGTWVVTSGQNTSCQNLPPDIIGSSGMMTSSESRSVSISDTFANSMGCAASVTSDTGWGATIQSNYCIGGGSGFINGIPVVERRQRVYQYSCRSDVTITLDRSRALTCPLPYKSRTYNGVLQCFIPVDAACPVSNPVSPYSGAKLQTETDYLPGSASGLEFVRYYNSLGHYRPSGIAATPVGPLGEPVPEDYWRHTYNRHLYVVAGNTELLAITQGSDGSLRSFDNAGNEIENTNGRGSSLVALAGGEWKVIHADRSFERYDSAGRLLAITTAAGQATTLTYAVNGSLSTVTGPFGHILQFSYNADGRLATITLPGTSTIQYAYDSIGRLTTVTYPDNAVKQYHYEDPSLMWMLTGITDESSQRIATYSYDASGRVSVSEHANGAERFEFSYGTGATPTTSVVDPLGASRVLSFANASGVYKASSSTQPGAGCGITKGTTYDSQGNVATRTDFNNNQTQFTYDSIRDLETSRTEAYGSPRARTITTQWDPVFRLPSQINEPGRQTAFTYDASGDMLTRTITDTATSQARTWTYTYNAKGQVLTIDGPRSDVTDVTTYTYYECSYGAECGQIASITNAAGHTTSFQIYNAHGKALSITDANNVTTNFSYDSRQRLLSRDVGGEVTAFSYYPTGLLKRVTLADASYLEYTYDAAHRLIRVEDAEGNRASYILDAAGNRTAENVYDPSQALARTRSFAFDSLGRLSSETDSASNSVSYAYDLNGNLEAVTDQEARLTSYAYDELNRMVSIVDPAQSLTQYSYTSSSDLATVTDPRALTTAYEYTGFGEIKKLASPDTGIATYAMDSGGNVQQTKDARNKIGTYAYDSLGRPTQITYSDQTIQFVYDQNLNGTGRLAQMSDASGSTHWTYTPQGRVASKQQTIGSKSFTQSYAYNLAGNVVQIGTPSGQTITFGYSDGHKNSVVVNGNPVLGGVLYASFGPTRGWNWANGTFAVREYDADGRLTTIDSAGLSTYTFYADGKIKSWSTDDPSPISPNGLTTLDVDTDSNQLVESFGAEARTYSYDSAGNIISDGVHAFTYNDAGRMVATTGGSSSATYALNGMGQRVRKILSGQSRYFTYDEAGHLSGEYDDAGALIQEMVWLDDIPVAVLKPNGSGGVQVFFVHTDHLNTPRKITRPADNVVVWQWNSDPFGVTSANEDPDGDSVTFAYNLRFPGQYYDSETGLHYNYFRDYDPAVGRYVQSDPIGLAGGPSTYAYAGSSPAMWVDSKGLLQLGWEESWRDVESLPNGKRGGLTEGWIENVRCRCSGSGECWSLSECSATLHVKVQISADAWGSEDAFYRRSESEHVADLKAGFGSILLAGQLAEESERKQQFSSKSACESHANDFVGKVLRGATRSVSRASGQRYDETGSHTWHWYDRFR